METSKYLYALKTLLWTAYNDASLFRSNSYLHRYLNIELQDTNECVILHHTCPILVTYSMYTLANTKRIMQDRFLKTITATFEYKDHAVQYKSNEHFIELDCQTWSQMERRIITECLKSILANRNVANKNHTILIHNIDALGEQQLLALRSIIHDNLHHARFIMTIRSYKFSKRLFGTNAIFVHCDYDVNAVVRSLLSATRPELLPFAADLVEEHRLDLSMLVATLHAGSPQTYKAHVQLFINEQLDGLLSSGPNEAYDKVTKLVCDLMSAYINIDYIWGYILEYFKSKEQSVVIEILATSQLNAVRSNKLVFAYEGLFMKLYSFSKN